MEYEAIDEMVIQVMRDGGIHLAEEAISKWYSGKYDPTPSAEPIAEWKRVKERIPVIAAHIRKQIRKAA